MSALDILLNQLQTPPTGKIFPVENWNPPLSGEMDMVIRSNGDWYHEGSRIHRQALVKLFASILKKENQDYFLVSPVEKWRIRVEDVPLLIVASERCDVDGQTCMVVKTATDDQVIISSKHPLIVRDSRPHQTDGSVEKRPYVNIRHNLEALVHRNVFYRWCEQAMEKNGDYGLWSRGEFFVLQ